MVDAREMGKFIAECRRQKKLTQKQLGERLNVTDRAVSKWETGRSFPDVSILENLCQVLDISVAELLAGKRLEPHQYQPETEKILFASVRDAQLYGFQIVLYLLQLVSIALFYLPFLWDRDTFLPGINPGNLLCWAACAIVLGCVVYLDKKIPGRTFRTSHPVMEGLTGGCIFIFVMLFCLSQAGGPEAMVSHTVPGERIFIVLIFFAGLILSVASRTMIASYRRRKLDRED